MGWLKAQEASYTQQGQPAQGAKSLVSQFPNWITYQPFVPGPPLKGPVMFAVIQPP